MGSPTGGAVNAAATPTSTVSTPAPTPAAAAAPSAPVPAAKPEVKKLDYGMGPQTKPAPTPTEQDYDDAWWEKHEPNILKHDRLKGLSEFKTKYQEAEPIVNAIKEMGGLEQVQQFYQFLGPVWAHLVGQGDKASEAWNKLRPIFENFLAGKELLPVSAISPDDPSSGDDEEESNPKIKALEARLKEYDDKFQTLDQKQRNDAIREINQARVTNYGKYEGLMKSAMQENKVPAELEDFVGYLISKNIETYMPKNKKGQPVNALDVFSEDAFKQTFSNTVLPRVKTVSTAIINAAKATVENTGPTVPNINERGSTVNPNAQRMFLSAEEKAARMAQRLNRLS